MSFKSISTNSELDFLHQQHFSHAKDLTSAIPEPLTLHGVVPAAESALDSRWESQDSTVK